MEQTVLRKTPVLSRNGNQKDYFQLIFDHTEAEADFINNMKTIFKKVANEKMNGSRLLIRL